MKVTEVECESAVEAGWARFKRIEYDEGIYDRFVALVQMGEKEFKKIELDLRTYERFIDQSKDCYHEHLCLALGLISKAEVEKRADVTGREL